MTMTLRTRRISLLLVSYRPPGLPSMDGTVSGSVTIGFTSS
jgi:hypothetical protein